MWPGKLVLLLLLLLLLKVPSVFSDSRSYVSKKNTHNDRELLESEVIIGGGGPGLEKEYQQQQPQTTGETTTTIKRTRTATGGFINSVLNFLTICCFIGNGVFMIYVFWLS